MSNGKIAVVTAPSLDTSFATRVVADVRRALNTSERVYVNCFGDDEVQMISHYLEPDELLRVQFSIFKVNGVA